MNRGAGEGKELGWEKAGRRIAHRQVEESRGSGENSPARRPRPSAAGKFVRATGPLLLGAARGGVGESLWPARLCPRGSGSALQSPQV